MGNRHPDAGSFYKSLNDNMDLCYSVYNSYNDSYT